MISLNNKRILYQTLTGIYFLIFFLYFFLLNRFHLLYLEQNQLFLFDWNYFSFFLAKLGGFIEYLSSFLIQFFINPWIAAAIVTLFAFLTFLFTQKVLVKHKINSTILPFIPTVLLASLLSFYNVNFAPVVGWLLVLASFFIYTLIKNSNIRYILGSFGILLFHFIAGSFSIVFSVFLIVHELAFRKETKIFYIISYIFLVVSLPVVSRNLIYYITLKEVWLSPLFNANTTIFSYWIAIILFIPIILVIKSIVLKIKPGDFKWKYAEISFLLILLLACFSLYKYTYEPKNEKFLEIDYNIQSSQWEKVLKLSNEYKGNNQLVYYFTNLALYKTGNLCNNMFHYKQVGTKGLWLDWKRNETAPYYGGEIYYHLAFNNEAFRWAFEAMEVKGLNPRCLKRLAITSLINNDYKIAKKYLLLLNQSMFYKNWAQNYLNYLNDTSKLNNDSEISEKRLFNVTTDFIATINTNDIGFISLLENHPNNKMAFEYLMASFLLNKNLKGFVSNIYRIKHFSYASLPVHFEEALILYMGLTKQNALPEGYSISQSTRDRFHNYAETFAMYRDSEIMAEKALKENFGGTFWYYMQFGKNNLDNNVEKRSY